MKIISILGSPRKNGSTAKVLDWVEQQLQDDGNQVEHVHIIDYDVKGCGECFACKTGRIELCIIMDDANELFRRMISADLILIATPLFSCGFPAQLKALIDRTFCLVGDYTKPDYKSYIQDKPLALLVTAGGPTKDNADLLLRTFESLAGFTRAKMVGHLLVPFCKGSESLDEKVRKKAAAFAKKLAAIPLSLSEGK